MKKILRLSVVAWSVCGFLICSRAGSLTNNFDSGFNYAQNGIVGDASWDGVYLRFGDVPGGNDGGDGAGNTTVADAGLSAAGYLGVNSTATSWAAPGNDGFFLYKVVAGDFDVSVQVAQFYPNLNYHFAGLLVRAYNPNNSGSAYSATTNAAVENFMSCTRFQEFGIGDFVKNDTNGIDFDGIFTTPGDANDTNTTRYVRITRASDVFSFYDRTNLTDSWSFIGSLNRPDLQGVAMQVGIQDAYYTGNSGFTGFTDFELSGTNVTAPPAMPPQPSGLTTSSPNINGSLTLSWQTNGGTGSIVIVRKISSSSGVFSVNPVQGRTYSADANFQSANTIVAGNSHVVYAGPATNVIVSGLGGSNNLYIAEVLSYSTAGPAIVYNTTTPATTSFLGSGIPASITLNVFPTNLPAGGVGQAHVIASFTTGDQVDVTTDPSTTVSSSDVTTVLIDSGVLNGLQVGTAIVSGLYAGFSNGIPVSVTPPRFTDNFTVSQNYLNNGLPGSIWDGIYDRAGDLPGATEGGGPIVTTIADANVTSNGVLTVRAAGTDWAGANDDGFLLFKRVPGDFQAVVHVTLTNKTVGFMFAGLLARASDAFGGPFNGAENWVYWGEFDQFGDSTEARFALDGADTEVPIFDSSTADFWLLMQRSNGTNFFFYRKVNATDPWQARPDVTVVQPNLDGVPLQVGPFQATYTSAAGTAQFDHFMLDADGLLASPPVAPPPPPTNFVMTLNQDISMTLNWNVGTNLDGTAIRSLVVMRAGAPVSAQPYLGFGLAGNSVFGDPAQDMGSGNFVVYRTVFGDTNTNQTVTVTGLSPGVTYYAAVYTFVGLGGARTFNTASQATASNPAAGSLQDGVLIGMQSTLAQPNGIPLGGIGVPIVKGIFSGGGEADITSAVNASSGDTNVALTVGSVLSGVAIGSTTVTITYAGFTNVLAVTVRPPGITDNFATSHDYLSSGVAGTIWNGVYFATNSFPLEAGGNDASVTNCDANITSNNVLTVSHTLTDWAGGDDDGFFLFKNVTGDFQAAVHITALDKINYQFAGLMARGYGTNGSPLIVGTNAPAENWVFWGEFEQFGDSTESRRALGGVDLEKPNFDGATNDFWLLINRQNGTHFTVYRKVNAGDPWELQSGQDFVQPNLTANVPLQVGLFAAMYTGNFGNAQFDSFLLDVVPERPVLHISTSGGNIHLTWQTASAGWTLQSATRLSFPTWQNITNGITSSGGTNSISLPITNSASFFRLEQ
jgi:regulation of enolase protein 1 (concanavalin A-like superfamily)